MVMWFLSPSQDLIRIFYRVISFFATLIMPQSYQYNPLSKPHGHDLRKTWHFSITSISESKRLYIETPRSDFLFSLDLFFLCYTICCQRPIIRSKNILSADVFSSQLIIFHSFEYHIFRGVRIVGEIEPGIIIYPKQGFHNLSRTGITTRNAITSLFLPAVRAQIVNFMLFLKLLS